MTKLRTNHARQSRDSGGGMIVKVGVFSAIIGALYYLFSLFGGGPAPATDTPNEENDPFVAQRDYFLPTGGKGQRIDLKYFTLSYLNQYEQAEWVAYVLSKEELQQDWNERIDDFRPDPQVREGSATPDDYRGSGYDRGHLVPAADMAFDAAAMQETFLMSNISPQARNFNQGIWRELEELTRNWVRKYQQLYIVSGPVFTQEVKGYIGQENQVAVPAAYFKVLLDLTEPERKGIAFVLPNEVSYDPLYRYALSIDEAERITGLNFFPDLMPAALEAELEAEINLDLWEFSKQKHDIRVSKWNQVR